MFYLYLVITGISLVAECRTFSKIANQLDKDYEFNDNYNRDMVISSLVLLSAFSFIPIVNILIPAIFLGKYDRVYDAAVELLSKENMITKKSDNPDEDQKVNAKVIKTREEGNLDSIINSKPFKKLPLKEKERILDDLYVEDFQDLEEPTETIPVRETLDEPLDKGNARVLRRVNLKKKNNG